ncbi:MAG: endo-1,4-beta-xylanase [Verrucomicrobia bacterium]|nr:MAG: endo-1,4-beta-xylanase [Verrucomicrobiota bacterium]
MITIRHPILVCIVLLLAGSQIKAQTPIVLWTNGAPGALGNQSKDIPTLTPFLPSPGGASGSAMLILPGGGYGSLTAREGDHYAWWFNSNGIAGFVLKYRLGSAGYRHPAMLQDATRAMRMIRAHAADWGVDPKRIGVIGSSAGGHLASSLLTHFDSGKPDDPDFIERQSSRPDLGVLCYPVITMSGPDTHVGSRRNLLGDNPSLELEKELSSELHVTAQTPPCFILHTWEDPAVNVENSLQFAAALRKARVPCEMHIYQKGPHGLGLGSRDFDPSKWHPWTMELRGWLREQGFAK